MKLKHADLYVVRLLSKNRKIQGSTEYDTARFGNSKPCLRCLRALDAAAVHRVFYTTGATGSAPDSIGLEMKTVKELLRESLVSGHHSRGDIALWQNVQRSNCVVQLCSTG